MFSSFVDFFTYLFGAYSITTLSEEIQMPTKEHLQGLVMTRQKRKEEISEEISFAEVYFRGSHKFASQNLIRRRYWKFTKTSKIF